MSFGVKLETKEATTDQFSLRILTASSPQASPVLAPVTFLKILTTPVTKSTKSFSTTALIATKPKVITGLNACIKALSVLTSSQLEIKVSNISPIIFPRSGIDIKKSSVHCVSPEITEYTKRSKIPNCL